MGQRHQLTTTGAARPHQPTNQQQEATVPYTLTLDRITTIDPHTAAVKRDYSCGTDPTIFKGTTQLGETVTAFVSKDGSAFVAIDADPQGYIEFSKAMSAGDFTYNGHGGVDENTMEPGTFDPKAQSIDIEGARPAFW